MQAYAILPKSFEDVVELLIPELQRRGLFWDDYLVQGGTYRETLSQTPGQAHPRSDHPASAYIWRAPEKPVAKTAVDSPAYLDPIRSQLG